MTLLAWFGRHGRWWLAAGVGTGLLLPALAEWLRPALPFAIGFTLTMALVRLDFGLVRDHLLQPKRLAWAVVVTLLASPAAAWLATLALPGGGASGLGHAVVLMAAAPPITASPAFALLVGLEAEFAVAAVLVTHALAPLSLPPLTLALAGLTAEMSLLDLGLRLVLLVGLAFAAAAVIKKLAAPDWLARQAPALDGLAVLGLLVFAIAVMAGATDILLARPGYFLSVLGLTFVANGALQVLGAALAWRLGPRIALTVGFMAGNCNMGLVLASLGPAAGPDVALYFALAQVPMYCMPLIATPIYRRIIARYS